MMNQSIKKENKSEYMNIVGDDGVPKSADVPDKKNSFRKVV